MALQPALLKPKIHGAPGAANTALYPLSAFGANRQPAELPSEPPVQLEDAAMLGNTKLRQRCTPCSCYAIYVPNIICTLLAMHLLLLLRPCALPIP